jgi:hypothetical protein
MFKDPQKLKFQILIFAGLILISFFLRTKHINWDQGYHMHPDERMLIMVADKIQFPHSLDPDFFNYGSLPVYILSGLAQGLDNVFDTKLDNYDGLLYVGRYISVFLDLITTLLIAFVTLHLFKSIKIAYLSALFYTFSFFPIQNSHFFIVDNFLNLFVILQVFLVLKIQESKKKSILILFTGITSSLMVTTKITAIIFLPLVLFYILVSGFDSKSRKIRIFLTLLTSSATYLISLVFFSFIFMPFGFIKWEKFTTEISMQLKMNSNPYIFPYTLQYVGSTPYFYYIKNIALWGLGIPLFSLFLIGFGILLKRIWQSLRLLLLIKNSDDFFQKSLKMIKNPLIIISIFYFFYFLIIGRSSVKFMRYMLLMYPFFVILAGLGAINIYEYFKKLSFKRNKFLAIMSSRIFMLSIIGVVVFWCNGFLNIYKKPNTRIQATEWIFKNIPPGSVIATEHWDDRVPIIDDGRYAFQELTIYDIPDDKFKWQILNQKLNQSDYIVIASNRLYTPLIRLQECGNHGRCYPFTKKYYEDLFSGKSQFKKVAEFTSYPKFKFGFASFELKDDSADESFTVYDHPKIMIFEKK